MWQSVHGLCCYYCCSAVLLPLAACFWALSLMSKSSIRCAIICTHTHTHTVTLSALPIV